MEDEKITVRLSVDVTRKLHKELRVASIAYSKSIRELVVEAIEDKLKSGWNLDNKE